MRLMDMTATALQTWGQRLDLMQQMFLRHGALQAGKEAGVAGSDLRAAMMTCLRCQNSASCKEWLGQVDMASTPPAFCPNGHRIAHLRGDVEKHAA